MPAPATGSGDVRGNTRSVRETKPWWGGAAVDATLTVTMASTRLGSSAACLMFDLKV